MFHCSLLFFLDILTVPKSISAATCDQTAVSHYLRPVSGYALEIEDTNWKLEFDYRTKRIKIKLNLSNWSNSNL